MEKIIIDGYERFIQTILQAASDNKSLLNEILSTLNNLVARTSELLRGNQDILDESSHTNEQTDPSSSQTSGHVTNRKSLYGDNNVECYEGSTTNVGLPSNNSTHNSELDSSKGIKPSLDDETVAKETYSWVKKEEFQYLKELESEWTQKSEMLKTENEKLATENKDLTSRLKMGTAHYIEFEKLKRDLQEANVNLQRYQSGYSDLYRNVQQKFASALQLHTNMYYQNHKVTKDLVYQAALKIFASQAEEIKRLSDRNDSLEATLELEQRRNIQILSFNAPKEADTGGGHGHLVSEYRTFTSQQIKKVTMKVVKHYKNNQGSVPPSLKDEVQSEFSKRILMEGMKLVESDKPLETIKRMVVASCEQYLNDLFSYSADLDDLKMEVKILTGTAIDLVEKIHKAPPKGRFFWIEPSENLPFDKTKHKSLEDATENDVVQKTILPGYYYYENLRLFEPALVITTKKEA